jgi:hypothetical protein
MSNKYLKQFVSKIIPSCPYNSLVNSDLITELPFANAWSCLLHSTKTGTDDMAGSDRMANKKLEKKKSN